MSGCRHETRRIMSPAWHTPPFATRSFRSRDVVRPGRLFLTAQVPNPPHEGAQEGHRSTVVRDTSQRFNMDMSAADIKRAASAQAPASSSAEPNGSEILIRCLQAEGVKFLWGYPGGAVL